jgi:hypothetical protein
VFIDDDVKNRRPAINAADPATARIADDDDEEESPAMAMNFFVGKTFKKQISEMYVSKHLTNLKVVIASDADGPWIFWQFELAQLSATISSTFSSMLSSKRHTNLGFL